MQKEETAIRIQKKYTQDFDHELKQIKESFENWLSVPVLFRNASEKFKDLKKTFVRAIK
jgi:hypothetical protein